MQALYVPCKAESGRARRPYRCHPPSPAPAWPTRLTAARDVRREQHSEPHPSRTGMRVADLVQG